MSLTNEQMIELYDRMLLTDNLMMYCRGADRMDIEGIRATYWPDSFDDHAVYVGPGQGWADAVDSYRDNVKFCSHHVSNVLCEIDGNRAKRESMFLCVAGYRNPDATYSFGGRYRDLCEKRDGVWKVLYRTCIWDWGDARELRTDWSVIGVPQMSNWGARYPEDPIFKIWDQSAATMRPKHQDPVK